MTNNNNVQGKIEKVDFYSALEDGLMSCLEHGFDTDHQTCVPAHHSEGIDGAG